MNAFTALLAFMIIYMPYQGHYAVTLPIPGVNLANLLFIVACVALLVRPGTTRTPPPLRASFLFFIAALVVSFFVGQLYDSSDFMDDLIALKTHVFYMLFFFLYYHAIRDIRTIQILFAALLLATMIVAVHCIRQGLEFGLGSFDWFKRAYGPFPLNGANFAAAFFIMFLPLFVSVFLVCKSRPVMRLLMLPAVGLGVLGMMFTFSRQALIVLPLLFLVQAMRRNLIVAVLILVALFNYEHWAPQGLIERIQMTTGSGEAEGARAHNPPPPGAGGEQADADAAQFDNSTAARFILWKASEEMFYEKPWGVGLNHFRKELPKHATLRQNDPHNIFVRILAEAGVLGITAFLVLLYGLLRLGGKLQKVDNSEDARMLGSAFTISVMGMIFANLFGSRLFDGEVTGNFWILAALVARYYTLRLEAGAAKSAAVPGASGAPGAKPAAA